MVPTLDVLFVQSILHYFGTLTSAYFSTDDTVEDVLVEIRAQQNILQLYNVNTVEPVLSGD